MSGPTQMRDLAIRDLDPSNTFDDQVAKLARAVRELHRDLKFLQRAVSIDGQMVVIKSGDASITFKQDGSIYIKGKDIASEASGDISIKAARNLVLKGQKILQN